MTTLDLHVVRVCVAVHTATAHAAHVMACYVSCHNIVLSLALPAPAACRHAHTLPCRLFRCLALGQRTRLRPQLPHGLCDQQAVGAADDVVGAAGAGGLDGSALAAARMVGGMPRLSALDLSGVGCSDSFTAFLRAAQRHLQAQLHISTVAGYSTAALRSVDPALLAACLPHLQRFEGTLPYARGAQCLQALACACPLQQLSCSIDQCGEATLAAIGACTTLRGLTLELRWSPETVAADMFSTQRVFGGLLPALAGLTRLTSLEVATITVCAIGVPSLDIPWPALAPLAALTALQRLRLSWVGQFGDFSKRFLMQTFSECLRQLPASSLSALTQLRLQGNGLHDSVSVDDAGLMALALAAPALQELEIDKVVGLDAVAPGSAAPWTMPHLTTLTLSSCRVRSVSLVCAAALLARAPRLRGLRATSQASSTTVVPLETHVRALAYVAAAGTAAICRLSVAFLPPAAELQAATLVAAPGGIALEVQVLEILWDAVDPLDDQQVAWLRSVVAWVDRVEVQLPRKCRASALSRGIFALPAGELWLVVPVLAVSRKDGGECLVEAVRFAVEAARPGQQVCVCAEEWVVGKDAIAEAEAIAHGALGKDIRVQIVEPAAW